jgi:hypothetical protein
MSTGTSIEWIEGRESPIRSTDASDAHLGLQFCVGRPTYPSEDERAEHPKTSQTGQRSGCLSGCGA